MLSDRTIKAIEGAAKAVHNGCKAKKLLKIMGACPDLWLRAYANIYPNKGALTRGVDDNTLDGFSMERVNNLIQAIKHGAYSPKPVRRVHIPKDKLNPKGKTRPLGIPTGDDKLVQEVMRMILEALYEPVFSEDSHGFRPHRSCHTALDGIRSGWKSTKWFCEVDIKGYFDNIDHTKLLDILKKRIEDETFLSLLGKFLKAGYVEDWRWNATHSGTPQGGIVSPILANVYLHELDIFMQRLKEQFNKGERRRVNREYARLVNRAYLRRKRLREAGSLGEEEARNLREKIAALKEQYPRQPNGNLDLDAPAYRKLDNELTKLQAVLRDRGPIDDDEVDRLNSEIKVFAKQYNAMPANDMHDPNFRRLHYVRYADDFLIGVTGTKDEAEAIRAQVRAFIEDELKLAVSTEKSRLGAFEDGCRFLGYGIKMRREAKRMRTVVGRRDGRAIHAVKRTITGHIHFSVPEEKCRKFVRSHGYGVYDTGRTGFWPRKWMSQCSEYEIVTQYNAEMRGFANYYNRCARLYLNKVEWIWLNSLIRTLGWKWGHMTPSAVYSRLRQPDGAYALEFRGKDGKPRLLKIYSLTDRRRISYGDKGPENPYVDIQPRAGWMLGRTELLRRLNAHICEYCWDEEGPFEVHHVRKMKDIAEGKSMWQRLMIARQRKTMVLCLPCHHRLHQGTLPDNRFWKNVDTVDGEPDA